MVRARAYRPDKYCVSHTRPCIASCAAIASRFTHAPVQHVHALDHVEVDGQAWLVHAEDSVGHDLGQVVRHLGVQLRWEREEGG